MTFKFDQTEQDYLDFNFYGYWARPERRWSRIKNRLILPTLCTAMIAPRFAYYGLFGIFIISTGLLYSIFATPIVKWYGDMRIRKIIRSGKKADQTGFRTVQFTEEGLIESTANSQSEVKWSAFEYLRETEKHLFLFVTYNQAFIFPKRIFASIDEMESLKGFINKKVAASTLQNNVVRST